MLKCISLNIQQGSNKADEILLNVMWQPGWEGSLGENEYMHMYGRVPFFFFCRLPETITTLLTGYTTIQNKKVF